LNDMFSCRGSAPLASGRSQVDLTSSTVVGNTLAQQMQQMLQFQQRMFEVASGMGHRAIEHGMPRGSVPELSSLRIRYPPRRSASAEGFQGGSPLALMDSPQETRSIGGCSGSDASQLGGFLPQFVAPTAASSALQTAVQVPTASALQAAVQVPTSSALQAAVQVQRQEQASAETHSGVFKIGGVQEQLLKMLKERQLQNREKKKKEKEDDAAKETGTGCQADEKETTAGKLPVMKRPAAAAAAEIPDGKKTKSAEKGLLLGCAKCRGCHTGCVQCKNPDFKGKRYQR
jgi:hypothetical protein